MMRPWRTLALALGAQRLGVGRFTRRLVVVLAAAAVWALGAAPAGAEPPADPPGPVSRQALPIGVFLDDPADGLVALGGPDAEGLCLRLPFEHDPADLVQLALPNEVQMRLVRDAELPMFLYQASSAAELCGALAEGDVPVPIATGVIRVTIHTNDAFASGTRVAVIGTSATGTLFDADGNPCQFACVRTVQRTLDGEIRFINRDIHLTC